MTNVERVERLFDILELLLRSEAEEESKPDDEYLARIVIVEGQYVRAIQAVTPYTLDELTNGRDIRIELVPREESKELDPVIHVITDDKGHVFGAFENKSSALYSMQILKNAGRPSVRVVDVGVVR